MGGKRLQREKEAVRQTKTSTVDDHSWYLDSAQSAPFGILVHNRDGRILFFNHYLEDLTGYTLDDIPDVKTWIKKIYPDESYRKIVETGRKRVTQKAGLRVLEAIITSKDGQKVSCRFSSKVTESGVRTVLIRPTGDDGKNTALAIQGYESLQSQFQSTPTPLLAWMPDGSDFVMSAYNKAAEKLTSGEITNYLGKSIHEFMEAPATLVGEMRRCIAERTTVEYSEPCNLPGADADFEFDYTFLFMPPDFVLMHISSRTQLMRTRESLLESERRYRTLVNMLPITIFETDQQANLTFCNRSGLKTFGYSEADIAEKLNATEFLADEDLERAIANITKAMAGEDIGVSEYTAKTKSGDKIPIILRSSPIYKGDELIGLRGFSIDVSELKKAQNALKKAYAEMEIKVAERTKELEEKADELQEVNTALRVLLRDQQLHKNEIEDSILINARELILPHMSKLLKSQLTNRQLTWLEQAISGLDDITSPLARNLSNHFEKLTPTELQVADLIKNGKSSKEVGEILGLAVRTIESHRKSIRRKLGLQNKKVNLQTHLSTL